MSNFELFNKATYKGYRKVPPRIRINYLGTLTINATGLRLAGWDNVEAILLYFDSEKQQIGLRAATVEAPGAIRLRNQGRTRTCGISAFAKKYNLLPDVKSINMSVRYDDTLGMLLADFTTAQPGSRSGRPSVSRKVMTKSS